MIFSKTDFSTILVVGSTKGETRSLRIKTKHINRVKQYAFTICLTVFLLTIAIIFLSLEVSKINKERSAYVQEIAHLKSQIPAASDTLQAWNYIQSIESKLEQINQYLKKRGIKGFTLEDIGGNDTGNPEMSPQEAYALYNERLEDVLAGVAFTPIGYPSNFAMSSRFGYRNDPMGSGRMEFHAGIDFRGKKGDAVKSTADGKVITAGWFQGYGKCVRIRHKNNLETLYGHLSKINVKEGQMVSTGQVIGQVGSTGHSTGNHLHYEVRKNGKPVNPRDFLSIQ
jgi:murein DD-endopeptidase MepM/ murein hydrolase activator NlpD